MRLAPCVSSSLTHTMESDEDWQVVSNSRRQGANHGRKTDKKLVLNLTVEYIPRLLPRSHPGPITIV